ncbi:MAG: CxxxxCH/CxxCH domain-containing protein [Deltaproteobacteria bacterium]|nr:CxxxxCH/CxxCH domain-containing protein [Deltaproteobacteria bacterium]
MNAPRGLMGTAAFRRLVWALSLGVLLGGACRCPRFVVPDDDDDNWDAGIVPWDAGPVVRDGGTGDGGDAGALDGGGDGGLLDGGPGDAGDGGDAGDAGDAGWDAGIPSPWPAECMDCHGGHGNPAPPRDVNDGGMPYLRGVGAHRTHLKVTRYFRTIACGECHVVPATIDAPGHNDTPLPAELIWGPVANAAGVDSAFDGVTCNTYCHGPTLHGGTLTQPEWTVTYPQQTYCGSCHGVPPPSHSVDPANGCGSCHPFDRLTPLDAQRHVDGILDVEGGGACGSCHGIPPPTPGHQTHALGAPMIYNGLDTAVDADAGTYMFGCGYCHPLDVSNHFSGGLADVEFYNPAAPPDTWKARNPASAAYTPGSTQLLDDKSRPWTEGTCTNVSCHSGLQTSAPAVPAPGLDFPVTLHDGGTYYPVTYPAYDVTRTPFGKPARWGGTLSCQGCHDYPPRTDAPEAVGGAGSSHASRDPLGYENLHLYNHGNEPVPCRACHFDTVKEKGGWTRDAQDVTTLDDIAIADVTRHINGQPDVALNAAEVVTLFGKPFSLADAGYDPATQTCSNVACHLQQTVVKWGSPYRWDNQWECNVCHQY